MTEHLGLWRRLPPPPQLGPGGKAHVGIALLSQGSQRLIAEVAEGLTALGAGRMIERRADVAVAPEQAELWAAKLRRRFSVAAHTLLRRTAAAAFRRRDFQTCDRLSAEAETTAL